MFVFFPIVCLRCAAICLLPISHSLVLFFPFHCLFHCVPFISEVVGAMWISKFVIKKSRQIESDNNNESKSILQTRHAESMMCSAYFKTYRPKRPPSYNNQRWNRMKEMSASRKLLHHWFTIVNTVYSYVVCLLPTEFPLWFAIAVRIDFIHSVFGPSQLGEIFCTLCAMPFACSIPLKTLFSFLHGSTIDLLGVHGRIHIQKPCRSSGCRRRRRLVATNIWTLRLC